MNEKLGISRTDLVVEPLRQISKDDEEKITGIAKKLMIGIPVQYVLGYTDFYGLRFKVNKNVLIPRPETEELVKLIIKESKDKSGLRVLDIGTGSGCIAIALAKGLINPQVQAIDISTKALEVAKENSILNEASVKFINADILKESGWGKLFKFDIIASNPPYVTERERDGMHVNVLNNEPHSALFVPEDEPLLFYNKISDMALKHLSPGSKLYFEINEAYGIEIAGMLESKGFTDILILKDLNGKDRIATGIFRV